MATVTREQLEGIARIYANNQAATLALGAAYDSFSRLCRRCGIEPPEARRRRSLRLATAIGG